MWADELDFAFWLVEYKLDLLGKSETWGRATVNLWQSLVFTLDRQKLSLTYMVFGHVNNVSLSVIRFSGDWRFHSVMDARPVGLIGGRWTW